MIITVYLVFCMAAVLWFDLTRYIIPNWLTGSMLVLYPVAVFMAPVPVDWKYALLGMLITFVVGYIAFARRWMGGGDIKLIVVCSLWMGFSRLVDFVFMVALLGGVFSVAVYVLRKLPVVLKKAGTLPRILRDGEPIPYGVAIAIAFLIMMWMGNVSVLAAR